MAKFDQLSDIIFCPAVQRHSLFSTAGGRRTNANGSKGCTVMFKKVTSPHLRYKVALRYGDSAQGSQKGPTTVSRMVVTDATDGQEYEIASLSESLIWKWDRKNLKHYSDKTPEEVQSSL